MKRHLLYALPLMLAACGPTVTKAGGEAMPAPAPPKADKAAEKVDKPEVKETQLAGSWSLPDNETAIFANENGDELVTIRCLTQATQDPYAEGPTAQVLAIQRPVSKTAEATTVDVFTGAGAFSMLASVDTQGSLITGTIDASSSRLAALAIGQGELKLAAGNDVYILPNSKEVEAVTEACRPEPAVTPAADENAEDSDTGTSEETQSSQM